MENISQMSMIEVACMLMEKKRTCQPIRKLIKEVLEMKGADDTNGELAAKLYIDITTSSKFVYMGNEEWDLKDRQSLDEWDKDGAAFNSKDDYIEEEDDIDDGITADDYILEEVEEDEEEEEEEELVIVDDEEEEEVLLYSEDDDDEDDIDYMDEDTYNEYMDDFEGMYDED